MRQEPTRSLLLLDANADERRLISAVAARAGWSAIGAADEETALGLLQGPHGREVQSVLLGAWDAESSPGLLTQIRKLRPDLPVIVLSHADSVAVAVEAMRCGASDFLVRPVAAERLLEALAANADRRRGAGELAPLSEKLTPELALEQMAGSAPEFRGALAVAAKAARNRLPILIVGEPGTGKESVARAIHAASLRAKGPLVELDCKAVPANIVDSELFGHEKGAFPGAFAARDRQIGRGRRRHFAARRDRRAAGRNPGASRPRACHRRSPPGGPQRQPIGRRPGHRHQQPRAARRFPRRPRRADRRDHRQFAAAARPRRRHSGACPPLARRGLPGRAGSATSSSTTKRLQC